MVGLLVLGAKCDISINCRAFEEMSSINKVKKSPGLYYVNMKPKYNLITGIPSKVHNLEERYFCVKVNEASVLDVDRRYRAK